MSIAASGTRDPSGESHAAERRERLVHLIRVVSSQVEARSQGATIYESEGAEATDLLDALRACSPYIAFIGCLSVGDPFIVNVAGKDYHDYVIEFSFVDGFICVHASRVSVTVLPLVVGSEARGDSTYFVMNLLEGYSRRIKLDEMTIDRAFLIGVSLVIGLMDDLDDDPGDDARLASLVAQVMPTSEELREIRPKLPPSTINYDNEELPY